MTQNEPIQTAKQRIAMQEKPATTTLSVALPEDLQNKINAVKALANTYRFLDQTLVTHKEAFTVNGCLRFIHALYEEAIDGTMAHPEAHKAPEYAELKKAFDIKNGKVDEVAVASRKKVVKLKPVKKKGKSNGKC